MHQHASRVSLAFQPACTEVAIASMACASACGIQCGRNFINKHGKHRETIGPAHGTKSTQRSSWPALTSAFPRIWPTLKPRQSFCYAQRPSLLSGLGFIWFWQMPAKCLSFRNCRTQGRHANWVISFGYLRYSATTCNYISKDINQQQSEQQKER